MLFSFFLDRSFSGAENSTIKDMEIAKVERKFFLENLIPNIEIEAEIKIPDYVDIKYIEYMYKLAKQLNLSIRMVFRLVYFESSFIDTIVSPAGAYGFFQIMPETYNLYSKILNVDALHLDKNCKNIYVGMHYLKGLYDYWFEKGNPDTYSWKLSLASYNAGIGKVIKYNGIPPYRDTIKYINFIMKEHTIEMSEFNFITYINYENNNQNRT